MYEQAVKGECIHRQTIRKSAIDRTTETQGKGSIYKKEKKILAGEKNKKVRETRVRKMSRLDQTEKETQFVQENGTELTAGTGKKEY